MRDPKTNDYIQSLKDEVEERKEDLLKLSS